MDLHPTQNGMNAFGDEVFAQFGFDRGVNATFTSRAKLREMTGSLFLNFAPATVDVTAVLVPLLLYTTPLIAVHLFGQCADLEQIARICKERKLLLVEDCAQCIGADYQGRRAGSWGDFGGFSFYPTKNLGGVGDDSGPQRHRP